MQKSDLGFPIYSPTQTMQWMACKRKWQLERQGWEATFLDWNPAQAVGSAVHAGWAAHNKGLGHDTTWRKLMESLTIDYVENEAYPFPQLTDIAVRGLERLEDDPPRNVLAAEEAMYGCIPDCITEEDGHLVVTQLKTSFKWDDRSQWFEKQWAQRQAEYETSWQLLHEAWAAQETFSTPVSILRVLHVGLTPRVWARVHAWPLSQAVLETWLRDWAKPTWRTMKEDRYLYLQEDRTARAPGNPLHCNTYGGCPFRKLCWTFAGNLEQARGFYAQKEKRG